MRKQIMAGLLGVAALLGIVLVACRGREEAPKPVELPVAEQSPAHSAPVEMPLYIDLPQPTEAPQPTPAGTPAPTPPPSAAPSPVPEPSQEPADDEMRYSGAYFGAVRQHLNAVRTLMADTYAVDTDEEYMAHMQTLKGHMQAVLDLPAPTWYVTEQFGERVRQCAQSMIERDIDPGMGEEAGARYIDPNIGELRYSISDSTPYQKWLYVRQKLVSVPEGVTSSFLQMEDWCAQGERYTPDI